MKNNIELEEQFNSSKKLFHKEQLNANFTYEDISSILNALNLNEKDIDFSKNNEVLEHISNLLKLYMDELTKCFVEDEERFKLLFEAYILIIESLTELAILFSKQKENRHLVNKVFQLLKESKNMIKLFIPLEEQSVNLLNNYLGRQLYHYTHIHYTSLEDKDIDYILQEHLMQIEGMLYGFELCVNISFANCKNTQEINEKMVLINNISFILLKLLYKFKARHNELILEENQSFLKIIEFFKKISLFDIKELTLNLQEFEEVLIKNFEKSAKHLVLQTQNNMFEEKTKLLKHNTDEYKQLIDIIRALENN